MKLFLAPANHSPLHSLDFKKNTSILKFQLTRNFIFDYINFICKHAYLKFSLLDVISMLLNMVGCVYWLKLSTLSNKHSIFSNCFKSIRLVGCLGLWHINLCRLFNAKSIFMKIVLFQTIQFSISTQFKCKCSLIMKNSFLSSYSV